jgi:LPS-assembly protein
MLTKQRKRSINQIGAGWSDAFCGPLRTYSGIAGLARMSGNLTVTAASLMYGTLAALGGTPAYAQDEPSTSQAAVYVEADSVTQDQKTGAYIAEGAVEARYGARIIRADQVIYYPDSDRAEAIGNVTIAEEDGTVTFADRAELASDLANAIATDFSVRLSNDTTIGAAFATRGSDGRNELEQAFYTACRGCNAKGETVTPTWRIKGRRVSQNTKDEMIYYRDAVLEVKGVPVLYTPYFAHADPSAGRKSGLLLPAFGESSRTGAFVEAPYLWNIGPSQDVVLAPRLMENANPLVLFEHRKQFYSGEARFQGSLTHEREFDDDGIKFDDERLRGHLFGTGEFAINDLWSWGFGLERVLGDDDLYFLRYEIDDQDAHRGLYRRGDRRLLSQVHAMRSTPQSIATISTMLFQGLRIADDQDAFPTVLPLVESSFSFNEDVLDGRVELSASAVGLQRAEGIDSRRITAQVDWRKPVTLQSGVLIESFANARADIYSVNDYVTPAGQSVQDEVFARGLGFVGAKGSWPVGRQTENLQIILEPLVQVVVSPSNANDMRIPNQDAISFELDEATLFEANRSPGYDLTEDGARATIGGRAEVRLRGTDTSGSLFIGQSYRAEDESPFVASTGLAGQKSDIVGEAAFQWNSQNTLKTRFRIDPEAGNIARQETDLTLGYGPASLSAKYSDFGDQRIPGQPSEELLASANLRFHRNWSTYYRVQRDLDADEDRRSFLGLVYDDECTRVELVYKRENLFDRNVGSGNSVKLQITLSSIGSFGQNR